MEETLTHSHSKRSFRDLAQKIVDAEKEARALKLAVKQIKGEPPSTDQELSSGEIVHRKESQISSSATHKSSTTGKRMRLDVNKIKKNVPASQAEGSRNSQKNFRDVVKTAMLVRNWMSNNQQVYMDRSDNSFSNNAFDPPSLAPDDAPILDEPKEISPPSPSGFDVIKSHIVDYYMQLRHLSINPSGIFYYWWCFIVFISILYNMLAMVIFIFDDVYRNFFWHWCTMNWVSDFVYIVDIFFNSRKVYMMDGMEVRNSQLMFRNYKTDPAQMVGSVLIGTREIGGRILLDLVCLIPLDAALVLADYISLLRTIRILKIHRFIDFIEITKQRSSIPHATKIAFLMLYCLILFHWNATVYFMFSLSEGLSEEDTNAFGFSYYKVFDPRFPLCSAFDDGCLMNENYSSMDLDDERPKYMLEAYEFWENKSMIFVMGNFSREYSMSMYWSSLTITTCGQQPYPSTSAQNMLEVVDTLIGVLVFATIIGSVGGVVYLMNQYLNEYRLQMDAIKFYMKYRNVRDEIRDRVLKCFMFLHAQHQLTDEKEILDCLPPRMQGNIASDLHMATVEGVSLFHGCAKGFLVDIVLRMRQQVFMPNDVLCKVGDKAKEMFIVKSGRLHVIDDAGNLIQEISDGCTYGEMSIIQMKGNGFGDKRQTGLLSVGYSDVYILNQDDVLPLLSEYPDERERLAENARHWLQENEMIEDGEELNMDSTAVYNIDEQLLQLQDMVNGIELQLDQRYGEFTEYSNDMKQRMTSLEWIMLKCRDEIKKDCFRGHF